MAISSDFEDLLKYIQDGVYFVDKDRRITYWNHAAELITGFKSEEVVGSRCMDNILMHIDAEGRSLCKHLCPLAHTIQDELPREADVFLHHKLGHRLPVHVRTLPKHDENGQTIGGIELFNEPTHSQKIKERLAELEQIALLDSLTQLPNRHYMESQLRALYDENQSCGISVGLLFIDIDHFKQFNDTYGHDLGDQILEAVAKTLASCIRGFDTVGRWGGEEFLGLFPNINDKALEAVGERLRKAVEHAFVMHQDEALTVTISIGATMHKNEETIKETIKRADNALYQSKKLGRNRLTLI